MPADSTSAPRVGPGDPLTGLGRLVAYLGERFPVVPYALLVAAFFGAGSLAAVRLGGGEVRWWGAPVVLLAFFHLRVFDEHKDFAKDVVSHPERLLSRGVVTLPMLLRWGVAAVVVEAALAAACGWRALAAWAAMFLFTVGMRYEFGVPRLLNRDLLLYAVSHNPVVALLAVFTWASTGAAWKPMFLFFCLAVSFGSLGMEIGRKTRLPDEEVPGVPSYSSVYGRRIAGGMVYSCAVAAAAAAVMLASKLAPSLYAPVVPIVGGVVLARMLAGDTRPQKQVEVGSSLALLAMLGGVAWAAW